MIFSLFWRTLHSTTALLYPTYASYKALCKRPADESELERWLMYWSVMGVVVAIEYTAEWVINWIPFYNIFKTVLLVYLAFPNGQGAAHLYTTHLYPLLRTHESQIDELLGSLHSRLWDVMQAKLREVLAMVGIAWDPAPPAPQQPGNQQQQRQPQRPQAPAGGWGGLWTAYGPSIVASAGALLRTTSNTGMNTPRDAHAGDGFQAPIPLGVRSASSNSAMRDESANDVRRRRELEVLPSPPVGFGFGQGHPSSLVPGTGAGQAPSSRNSSSSSFGRLSASASQSGFLVPGAAAAPGFPVPQPHPPPSPARSTHSTSSSGGDTTRGGFEEVGYDLSGDESATSDIRGFASPPPRRGGAGGRPDPARRQSWWNWASGGPGGGAPAGYQPVHNKDD